MIITKTPFRISFTGGGSDIEDFYLNHNGAVLSTTINKYMYISSHKFFESDKIRIKYSKTETVDSIDKIEHPIVKEVLKKFSIEGALEISSIADVPAGTGVGSSSSFTVGLLHNLYTRFNVFATKKKLANEACDIEINKLKEPIGSQDQYAAAFGGLNVIKFNTDATINVELLHLNKDIINQLENNLILFYTGEQRKTSSILIEQKNNMSLSNKIKNLKDMVNLVWIMRDELYKGRLEEFGKILHINWELKKELASRISNTYINEIYNKALKNGALGGKLLGAGGSGFLLFYCEKEKQDNLKKALYPLKNFPFKFDKEGSKVIYVGDENE